VGTTLDAAVCDSDLDAAWRARHLAEQEILQQSLEAHRRQVEELQRLVVRLEHMLANAAAYRGGTTATRPAAAVIPRRWMAR
jgi:hypothetical protein